MSQFLRTITIPANTKAHLLINDFEIKNEEEWMLLPEYGEICQGFLRKITTATQHSLLLGYCMDRVEIRPGLMIAQNQRIFSIWSRIHITGKGEFSLSYVLSVTSKH